MNLTVNNFSQNNNIKPLKQQNFKSTFPAVHWIAEVGSGYFPVQDKETVKLLQRKLVTCLNSKPQNREKLSEPLLKFIDYIKSIDYSYRNNKIARSFYDIKDYAKQIKAKSFFITGGNVEEFERKFSHEIGRSKRKGASLRTETAQKDYFTKGLEFVMDPAKAIKDEASIPYTLHTKFQIIRNKTGKIVDYRFQDARFLPSVGSNNPLEKYNSRIR